MRTFVYLVVLLLALLSALHAGESPITLWPQGALGALGTTAKEIPTLAPHLPAKANGAMQQHRDMAHSDGWPFPAWQQSTGHRWHFSTLHEPWAIQNFRLKALTTANGWEIAGAEVEGINPARGLKLRTTGQFEL